MKILVTGFDPFDGEAVNPAWEAVRRLPSTLQGAQIVTAQVPTVFGDAIAKVRNLVELHHPDAIVNVGQAGGRRGITVERVAINIDDARIADNAGNTPIDQPVVNGGPAAYFATVPIKAMVAAIRSVGLPGMVSNTAGTFVCNHLMYGSLFLAEEYSAQKHPVRAGFIHVPFLPEQVEQRPEMPSMSLDDIVAGLSAAIGAIVTTTTDLHAAEGTEF